MSKKVKNKSKKYQSATDFTIDDSANAKRAHFGTKKQIGCNSHTKLINIVEREENSQDVPDPEDKNPEIKNSSVLPHVIEEENFVDYCIDTWWLISEYIKPEDILRFALICRKTASVVRGVRFWNQLYKNHSFGSVSLPYHLQSSQIAKYESTRCAVIRSLFYTYPPFKTTISQRANRDPACLIGKCLELMWFTQNPGAKSQWTFIYKFKAKGLKKRKLTNQDFKKKKISFPAENCHFLLITTRKFRPLPQFHGQEAFLKLVTRPLASGFSELAIRLTFENYQKTVVQTITYDTGVNVQVIDWFSPLFEEIVEKICDFNDITFMDE
ncbi:uncharacterized protein DMENIID0001_109370 [Sergentomyia squamirostris]